MNFRLLFGILRNFKVKSFEKGKIIIPKGSQKNDIYFIRKGLVRSYSSDEDYGETTFQLYSENQFFTNAHCVLFNETSKFNYQSLEQTKVYTADYSVFLKLTSENPDLPELNRAFYGRKIIK